MNKLWLNPILKSKARYFDFLIDRAFRVSNASNFLESFGNWFVEFESSDCYIVIFSDREEVFVRFYPVKADRKNVTDLGFMLYFLSGGKLFIRDMENNAVPSEKQQLKKLSSFLEEYIDRILPYFGRGYEKNKDDLTLATKEYEEFLLTRYGLQKMKGRLRGL
jgi:hypothetical protein